MTFDIAFIGTHVQLRIDGSYVATYENIEQLEIASAAYAGQAV